VLKIARLELNPSTFCGVMCLYVQRKLTDNKIVGLCSEFLGAGTEPVTAALQWIMQKM
jgi:cytochrome P450